MKFWIDEMVRITSRVFGRDLSPEARVDVTVQDGQGFIRIIRGTARMRLTLDEANQLRHWLNESLEEKESDVE